MKSKLQITLPDGREIVKNATKNYTDVVIGQSKSSGKWLDLKWCLSSVSAARSFSSNAYSDWYTGLQIVPVVDLGELVPVKVEPEHHCQICGAAHMDNTGVISYHGYTLDYGFFNGPCKGSRHLAYEFSRDLLGEVIPQYAQHYSDTLVAYVGFNTYPPAQLTHYGRNNQGNFTVVRPDDFKFNPEGYYPPKSYGRVYQDKILEFDRSLVGIKRELARLQARYDNWVGAK